MQHYKIAFIGAGNMVRAMVSGLVDGGYPADLITVCAPSAGKREALSARFNVHNSADNVAAAQSAEVIVLAVPADAIVEVCRPLKEQVNLADKLILSVVTGVTLQFYDDLLGADLNIIRAMPNMPCAIGRGMIGLYAPPQTTNDQRDFAEALIKTTGKVCWLGSEDDINKIIAISGSAPAYFYLFMEAIQQHAQQLGFNPRVTRMMVEQTALGAVEMVINNPNLSINKLREQATSPGGATAQAIQVFKDNNLDSIVAEAMQAASEQARIMEDRLNIKYK